MSVFALLSLVAVGGGQSTNPGQISNADGTDSKFADSVLKVPVYPGARMIAGSSQRIRIDKAKGWLAGCQRLPAGGWGRAYRSNDDFKLVESYYSKQGAKFGKLNLGMKNYNTTGFLLAFDLPKKERMIFVGSKLDKDGSTQFEVYYFLGERGSSSLKQ